MSHPMRDLRKLKESLEQSVQQIEAKKGVDYRVLDLPPIDPTPAPSRLGQYILGGSVAAIVLAIATSVFADPVGVIGNDTYVEIVGVDVGYVVEFHNQLSTTTNPGPFFLVIDGMTTEVVMELTTGKSPDSFHVIAPTGFYCDPCNKLVPEGEVGQVFLYPMGLS